MSNTVVPIEAEAVLSPRRQALDKAKRWSSLLAKFVSVQVIVQVIGLVAGLLLVRTLSQREYAYFTLANTMQATLLLLADVGVGSALSAMGGKVWDDRQRFSELIVTGLLVRKNFAWIGGGVALPFLCWMLIHNGTSLIYAVIISIAVLLGASYRLTSDVLTTVPRLHGQVGQLQKLDLISNVVRVILISAACVTFINAALGVFAASVSFGVQYFLLRRWTQNTIDLKSRATPEDRRAILSVVKQQAPNTIYYCVQGQLMVFLISVFGHTNAIAEIGALGRLAVLFAVINSITVSVIMPRFARCQEKQRLRAIWWQVVGGYLCFSLVIMVAVTLEPETFLWLLGKNYTHLGRELAYVVFSTSVSMFTGLIYGLNVTRAWLKGAWLSIPITIVSEVAMLPFVDLGSIKGVALLGCLPTIPGAIPFLYRTYRSFQEMPNARMTMDT